METVDILFLIAFVFVLISGVYSFINAKKLEFFLKNDKAVNLLTLDSIAIVLFVIGAVYFFNKPKAIDVYRDKTELKITYENDVPTDSCVVFKK